MVYTIDKRDQYNNYKIVIRLNDACRNGYEDFSITATFWEVGKARVDRRLITGGCCHDDILRVRPDLEPFVKLHLCDFKGAPMHAVGNGWYYAVPGQYHHHTPGPEAVAEYLRCDANIAEELCGALDKDHFTYLIHKHGLPELWKKEAEKAIAMLEAWTGEKFTPANADAGHWQPDPYLLKSEAIAEQDGIRTPEAIAKRKREVSEQKIADYIAKVSAEYAKKRAEIDAQEQICLALAREFGADWVRWTVVANYMSFRGTAKQFERAKEIVLAINKDYTFKFEEK